MLKQLSIKNYQSHQNTVLNFDDGVNIIVGKTDSGKTAIIRALLLLINNKPGGEAFRSYWGGNTIVKGIFDDEQIVIRKKGTTNEYICNGTHYIDFGANVPEDVQKALNIDEVNIQQQGDEPFLLSKTPGKLTEYFNKIANIDLINTGITNAQKEIRSYKKLNQIRRQDLKEKKKQLQKYDNIETIEQELNVIEKKQKKLDKQTNEKITIENIVQNIKDVEIKIKKQKQILKYETLVNSILEKIERQKTSANTVFKITKLKNSIESIDKILNKNNKLIKFEKTVVTLQQKTALYKQCKAKIATLTGLVAKYVTLNNKYKETNDNVLKLQKVFEKNLIVCPLCGTKIKNK
jgi:DNA repair ATPase RecN